MDNDVSDENKASSTPKNISEVNDFGEEQVYLFQILLPRALTFSSALRNGAYKDFKSELEVKLRNRLSEVNRCPDTEAGSLKFVDST